MESKILIVDDDKEIRNLISVYLENEGLKTQKAEDAIQALQLLEEKEFDLVILDLLMPDIDGSEIHELLKITNPEVRILFTSGVFE